MAGMVMKIACVVVACMVVSAEAYINCEQVGVALLPCLRYIKSGGAVSPGCCNGVRRLNSIARTTTDRRIACRCLKKAYAAYPVNPTYALTLPAKCGVRIPYRFSPQTDCSRVQ